MSLLSRLLKPNIEKMRVNGDIEGLIAAFDHEDSDIQEKAALALKSLPGPKVRESLLAAVKDNQSFGVRWWAGRVLVQLGDTPALKPWIGLLILRCGLSAEDVSWIGDLNDLQSAALLSKILLSTNRAEIQQDAEALGDIGDGRVVELLVLAPDSLEWSLDHSDDSVRDNNARRAAGNAFEIIIRKFIQTGHSQTRELLLLAIQSSCMEMQEIAAKMLPQVSDPQTSEALIRLLIDGGGDIPKNKIVDVLAETGDTRAIHPIVEYLKDYLRLHLKWYAETPSDWEFNNCAWAIKRLGGTGNAGDAGPLHLLQGLLDHGDPKIRAAAAEALGQVDSVEAVPNLLATLRNSSGLVRETAAQSLKKFKDPQSVDAFRAVLLDPDQSVRACIVELLDQAGWQPGRDEVGAAYWISKENWEQCIQMGEPAMRPLIVALKDKDQKIRAGSVRALQTIRDPRAIEPLIAALLDEGEGKIAIEAALEAFGELAVEPLTAALKGSRTYQQMRIVRVLGSIKDPRAVDALIAVFESGDEIKRAAARALGEIGDIRAAQPLCTAFMDERYRTPVDPLEFNAQNMHTEIGSALKRLGPPGLVPLALALVDSDVDLRGCAAKALVELEIVPPWLHDCPLLAAPDAFAKIGLPVVEPLLALLAERRVEDDTKPVVIGAILKMGQPAVDLLIHTFRHNWRARYPILKGFAQPFNNPFVLQDLQAEEVLVESLRRGSTRESSEADTALGMIGWQTDDEELLKRIYRIREDRGQMDAAERISEMNRRYRN